MASEGKVQAGRSLAKDFHRLMKNIDSFSGGQARLASWDETDLKKGITVAVVPDSGLYKDGEFMFEIFCNNGYPDMPPDVYCLTQIYHPNIHMIESSWDRGDVCVSSLDDERWSPSTTLEDVVQGILFLMHNPNLEEPLFYMFHHVGEEEFVKNVRQSLDGGWVMNYHFERNRVTRGEDGEIVRDGNSPEEVPAAVCRKEQPSKTVGEEEDDARLAGAAAESKTTDDRKKIGRGEKGEGETRVIGVS